MQTFLASSNFQTCAACLDDKRLYKQIVECKQILQTLERVRERDDKLFLSGQWESLPEKIAWENHPAVLMWEGYEDLLRTYQLFMLDEWLKRRWDAKLSDECYFDCSSGILPPRLCDERLHRSHRANLYWKDKEKYSVFKQDYDLMMIRGECTDGKPDYYWPIRKGDKR